MNEKRSTVFTIAVIASIILIFSAADLIQGDRIFSETENKVLASRPDFTLESLLQGKYTAAYEDYITDQFVSRDKWISIKTYTDIALGRQEINGVYLCKDGYLIERHLPEQYPRELVAEKLALLQKLVEKWDAKVMLVPTADNILTDKLPYHAPFYDEAILLEQAAELLGEEHYIDIYTALKEHSDEDIYYRTDHHWTSLGAYYGYAAWMESQDEDFWKTESLEEKRSYYSYDMNRGPEPRFFMAVCFGEMLCAGTIAGEEAAAAAEQEQDSSGGTGLPKAYEDYYGPDALETVTEEFLGTLHSKVNLNVKPDAIQYFPETLRHVETVTYDLRDTKESCYEESYLDTKNKYGFFMDDNHAIVEIETDCHNGKTLFVIKDSYANCFVPMLTPYYEKIYVMDLRYYNGRLFRYMESCRPKEGMDVLVLYNCIHFLEDFMYLE